MNKIFKSLLLSASLLGLGPQTVIGDVVNVPALNAQPLAGAPRALPSDLQIVNLVFPTSFNQMDRVEYSLALKNNGPGPANIPAGMRYYSVFVDGREISGFDAWSPKVLVVGESMPFSGNIPIARTWFPTAGAHALTVTADPGNRIAEGNEGNNTATQALNVVAAPTSDVIFGGAVTNPPNPTTATPFKVTVTVTNRGPAVADLNGTIIDSPDCPGFNLSTGFSLQPGASRSFDLGAPQGWYQVGSRTCTVIIGGIQTDPDLSNNRGTFSFTVAAPPAAGLKKIQAQPDLQIVNLVFPASFNQADRVNYSLELINNGAGPASIPSGVRLYSIQVDGRELSAFDSWQPTTLAAGDRMPFRGNIPIARTWFPTAGTHTITATADPGTRIAETNEGNNTATQVINVTAMARSDVIFGGATVEPANPTTTTPFRVTVTVTNRGPGVATLDGTIIDSPDCPGFNLTTGLSLQPGASRAFQLGALQNWYQVGTRTCTVVIGGVQNDPELSNNRGSFSFTISR